VVVVAGWAALAIASALERVRAGWEEAERGRVELGAALETIEHQRRVSDAILDTVDVGLVLLDGNGVYQAMNRRHQAFMRLGYPEGHAGRAGQLGEVYAEDGTTPLRREEMPTHRASRGEEFDDCRIWIGHDPRTNRALSVSARSVRDEAGTFTGAALAYNDVTDFMQAMRVKDEFIASVSHELRTPLTSISGYVSILLEREDLPQQVLTQLEVVDRNADRLRRLVSDLLHTAQADEGPMHVVRSRTDVSEIVRQSVRAAGPAARAAEIDVEVEAPDVLLAVVDPQRMAQVVDNLVSNALKYTPSGGSARVVLGVDGDRLELAVTDTGIGIEAADLARLFTRFFRARHAAEQSIQGVGLGLSITRSIVESHGGRIEVESEVGRGSTFRVRVPLDVEQPAAHA
jgi:signal transduction histidine kinase